VNHEINDRPGATYTGAMREPQRGNVMKFDSSRSHPQDIHRVKAFTYNETEVRVVIFDREPWFVAADIVEILGLGRVHDAVRGLDDDEKGADTIRTLGGDQRVTTISEAGLYSLILRSRKPGAKAFRRWLTHQVLPAIRKTGAYGHPPVDFDLGNREHMALIIKAGHAALVRAMDAEARAADIQAQNVELRPAARAWETLVDATGDYSVREAAQILSRDSHIEIGQRRLFSVLRSMRWIQDATLCYQRHVDMGRLRLKTDIYCDPRTGVNHLRQQIRLTARGLADLHQYLADETEHPMLQGGGT
jgi:anti-repressor protein